MNFSNKLSNFSLASFITLSLMLGLTHAAQAAGTATLNITGTVEASPCKVDASSSNMNIDLGSGSNLQSADLNAAGSSSAWIPFSVKLISCPAGTSSVTATFSGTADANDPDTLYANTGTATNVAVQLEGKASEPYGNGKTSTIDITTADAHEPVWNLKTRAYTTDGSVKPGTISSVITMTFAYN